MCRFVCQFRCGIRMFQILMHGVAWVVVFIVRKRTLGGDEFMCAGHATRDNGQTRTRNHHPLSSFRNSYHFFSCIVNRRKSVRTKFLSVKRRLLFTTFHMMICVWMTQQPLLTPFFSPDSSLSIPLLEMTLFPCV